MRQKCGIEHAVAMCCTTWTVTVEGFFFWQRNI